jgi:hypothetical protein
VQYFEWQVVAPESMFCQPILSQSPEISSTPVQPVTFCCFVRPAENRILSQFLTYLRSYLFHAPACKSIFTRIRPPIKAASLNS